MTLKYTVSALADVPEALQSLYAETDGQFILQTDGMAPRQELDELRDSNIAIRREIEAIGVRYEGVDRDEWQRLLRQERIQRDLELFEAGRGDEVIAERVAPMQAEHARVVDSLKTECDALQAQVNDTLLESKLRAAAIRGEVLPSAIDDVLLRGRQTFRVEGGKLVAYQADAPLVGRHGAPLGVAEWVAYLGRNAPHMFAESASGNSPGGSQQRTGRGSTINRATFDRLDPWEKQNAARTLCIVD